MLIISPNRFMPSVVWPLMIFKHVGSQAPENEEQNRREALLGCAPAYRLFDLLEIHRKEGIEYPRKYEDYIVSLNASDLPLGVKLGFKNYPFEPVEWIGIDSVSQPDGTILNKVIKIDPSCGRV